MPTTSSRPSATPPTGSRGTPTPPPTRSFSWPMVLLLLAMLGGMWLWRSAGKSSPTETPVNYSTFYTWVNNGLVKSVNLKGQAIDGQLSSPQKLAGHEVTHFQTRMPERDDQLLPLLRQKSVRIKVTSSETPFAVSLLVNILPWVLIIGVWVWLSRRASRMMGGAGGGPLGSILRQRNRRFEQSTSVNVTFDDVAGLGGAKRDLLEIVEFLKHPERFRRMGGKVPRGVLLVGPPGTGKTLLARAVAGESGVPFYSISASEFIELFVGVGAARVRDLFDEAKKNAPAIIFIDEIDAVGRSRGAGLGGGHDEREQTLNQLLSEMDGFNRNDLTVVIAATNRPDVLDPALLRPGRFDRRVIVDRPERGARRAILDVHSKGKPLADDVNLDQLARDTPGFSGADLANLVNEAALSATRRAGDQIHARDFRDAFDKIVLGDPREGKLDVKEKQRVATHESGHAVVAHFSRDAESLHRITIIPRGMALGATQQTPAEDRHIMTQPELEARLRVLMGGYAAERHLLGNVSTGAEADLKEATDLASKMVANYGMSEKLGPVYFEHQSEHPFLGRRFAIEGGGPSDATVYAIESEARRALARAHEQASQLIAEHRDALERLRAAVLERESLEGAELTGLLDGTGPAPTRAGADADTTDPDRTAA